MIKEAFDAGIEAAYQEISKYAGINPKFWQWFSKKAPAVAEASPRWGIKEWAKAGAGAGLAGGAVYGGTRYLNRKKSSESQP